MSVVTTADERLNSAAEHVKAALSDLSDIVISECWGHDDFRADYRAGIETAFSNLMTVKTQLNR